MTDRQLKIANTTSRRIDECKNYLNKCSDTGCTSIVFSGGGSEYATIVCTDSDIIKLVRELIISETCKKLQKLEEEFTNL